ncbi:MAG: type II toxin-antitoxin system RelE/ParE family toxin [Alphaproteobacteria bacterium]|nr:type II toxin-antitoxin system RelE/ParE family toxin [Alphaproteobacteria bacterium]
MSHAEREELIDFLANSPVTVAPLPRTGGVRKIRWASKGKGKSGGVRVIYYYHSHQMPLYLFSVFGKSDKDNLTRAEENDLRQVTAGIKAVHRGRRRT